MSAPAAGLVGAALRCYPAAWRRRHGEEAAEAAAQLLTDGMPLASIVLSYVTGAVRERLAPRAPRHRSVAFAVMAALAGSVALPFVLLGLSPAASAASVVHSCAGHHRHVRTDTLRGQAVNRTGSQHDRQCESG